MFRFYTILLFITSIGSGAFAQNYWQAIDESAIQTRSHAQRYTVPQKYGTYSLDLPRLKAVLAKATKEKAHTVEVSLPLPDGKNLSFEVFESTVMHPNLAARYPMIKTYAGQSTDKKAKVHLDITNKGVHAVIDMAGGSVYIDPYAYFDDRYYMSYHLKDLLKNEAQTTFDCGVTDEFLVENTDASIQKPDPQAALEKSAGGEPVQLRTYRMAIATTAEYTNFHGGTTEDGLSAVVTKLNRLNMVFERDLAIRMELIEDNDQIIYFGGANADPFTNGSTGDLIGESQATIDAVIGVFGYDFGHVLSQGGWAGLAQLGAACGGGKARGASTMQTPIGDGFVIQIIAHEMGHQMGAQHSMSSCHNVNSGTAYEPGSGSTIMAYAGICGPENNIVNGADDYYFTYSLTEMHSYMYNSTGNQCAARTNTGNTTPSVEIPLEDGFYIPISTPFEMTANATDAEGDNLTYTWGQLDLGPMSVPGDPMGNCPLFRSYPPSDNPQRVFPRMATVVNNAIDRAEVLPPYSRDMTFRCTVRDNNMNGGGVSWDAIAFEATESAGPFKVMHPNSLGTAWTSGSYVAVEWDVANTDNALVNCQTVNILLSTDGGYTYPITLASNVPNDGLDYVLVPEITSTQARVKIKAADNIFFDISDANFRIAPPTEAGFSLAAFPDYQQVCLPEAVTIDVHTTAWLDYESPIALGVENVPSGAIATFANTSISPAESTQLTIDFSEVTTEDTFELELYAIAETDTITRHLVFTTVSNDFTTLEASNPPDGTSGVSELPIFEWTPAEDADFYTIQIATNPAFDAATIVEEAQNLTAPSYTPSDLLEENTLYYWRIFPHNECGMGTAIPTVAFHSKSVQCATQKAADTPITISTSALTDRESKISVIPDGVISDINIRHIKGTHEFFSDLRFTLTSPAGTQVTLFAGKCANYNGAFDLTLDDEAPSNFRCPPMGTMRPQQALSAFIGESTSGIWTLRLEDTVGGGGGNLEEWSIEFCADINLSNPQLLVNEPMPLPPGTSRRINDEFLYAEDTQNPDWQLRYTIVRDVQHGTILFEGVPVSVGDQFNQGDVTWNKVAYLHDGSEATEDSFEFTIVDGDGGWTGTHTFQMVIDPNVVVATNDIETPSALFVYPNPTDKHLTVQVADANTPIQQIRLYDLHGKTIALGARMTSIGNSIHIDVSQLPKGIYLLHAQVGEQQVVRKVGVL